MNKLIIKLVTIIGIVTIMSILFVRFFFSGNPSLHDLMIEERKASIHQMTNIYWGEQD